MTPFELDVPQTQNIYGRLSPQLSLTSDFDNASTTNILNGCPIRKPKDIGTAADKDESHDTDNILHNIYTQPTPPKVNGNNLSPESKNSNQK